MSKAKAKQAKVKVKAIRFEHTYSRRALSPNRLIDLSTNRQTFPNHIGEYPSYHRYKGLSSIPNLAGNREDTLDTKYSIYKHYMPDMGIWGYKGLIDMKV